MDWFLITAPIVWAAISAGRIGAVYGALIGVGLLPLALNEVREARGGPRLRRTHPYLDALLGVPVCPALVSLIAPDAALGWFITAGVVGAVLSLVGRRRELVRKANEANRRGRARVA